MDINQNQIKPLNGCVNGVATNGTPDDTTNGTAIFVDSLVKLGPAKRQNPEAFLPVPKLRFGLASALVFTISVLCFCINYNGDFVYDDKKAILENKDLLPETPVADLFSHDFWGHEMISMFSHKSYRPLTVLTFKLAYYLAGRHHPPSYHIPNLILHGIISVFLLRVFSILFGGYEVDPGIGVVRFKAAKSALLCTILFAIHPVHTESVSGIVGRADLLCALLFLLSFFLYIKSCAKDLQDSEDRLIIFRPPAFSVSCVLGSMLMCFLSVLCKEQGITVIGICSAYDIVVICEVEPFHCFGLRKNENSSKTDEQTNGSTRKLVQPWILSLMKRHLFLLTTGLLILVFRWRVMGSEQPKFMAYDNPHSFLNGTFIRGLNYNYLYSIHAWLLVHPWWLCNDWAMGCVPVIESFADARIICAVAVWIVIGALLVICLKTPVTKDNRVLTMALAFIIVPFIPASNVFFRVGFVVAERILYLSSIGFCMVIVLGIRQICAAYPKHVQIVKFAMVSLFCVFVLRCIQRSYQWRDELTLFQSAAEVCPLNARVHFYLAKLHEDLGNEDYAIEKYKLGLEFEPFYASGLNNLGLILLRRGELDEAEGFLKRAVNAKSTSVPTGKKNRNTEVHAKALNNLAEIYTIRGDLEEAERLLERSVNYLEEFASAWLNLGVVRAKLHKYKEAEFCYQSALKYSPGNGRGLTNLGNLYLDMNMFDKAVEAWTNATVSNPTLISAWANLVFQLDAHERYNESLEHTKRALRHHPDNARLYFNLGNVYGKISSFEESEENFLKAIKLDPTTAQFYANFGAMYARWMKYDLAELNYKKALKINPNEPNVKENLARLPAKIVKSAIGVTIESVSYPEGT